MALVIGVGEVNKLHPLQLITCPNYPDKSHLAFGARACVSLSVFQTKIKQQENSDTPAWVPDLSEARNKERGAKACVSLTLLKCICSRDIFTDNSRQKFEMEQRTDSHSHP